MPKFKVTRWVETVYVIQEESIVDVEAKPNQKLHETIAEMDDQNQIEWEVICEEPSSNFNNPFWIDDSEEWIIEPSMPDK